MTGIDKTNQFGFELPNSLGQWCRFQVIGIGWVMQKLILWPATLDSPGFGCLEVFCKVFQQLAVTF